MENKDDTLIEQIRPHDLLNSQELDDVISKPPPAIIGVGVGIMAAIVVILMLVGSYVKYPTLVNSKMFVIAAIKKNDIMARMLVPEAELGRIKTGQTVYIRLTAYPAERNGQLYGTVSGIGGNVDKDGNISVVVKITSAVTDAGKALPLFSGMRGNARILTDKASLLKRMYTQLISVNNLK